MPEKDYIEYFTDIIRMIVYFYSDKNDILNFVVKLEFFYLAEWKEVERYDCFHEIVHKDIFNIRGVKKRVIKYEAVDQKAGLNMAVLDFKENYQYYIWRFIND